MGFGRGRLKLLFSQLWNRINGDKPVDLIYQNLKLRLQPRQNTIESKIMFSAKQREGAELALIKRHLADGGVFVDIGSNIGYYALNVALMSAGKIIAIEPNPPVLARLRDNIALNDLQSKITVHDVAIGAARASRISPFQIMILAAAQSSISALAKRILMLRFCRLLKS